MRIFAAWLLLLASSGVLDAAPLCKPPAKAGSLLGMPGCVQPDGTLLTAKGFRIGVKKGAGGGVEVTPPAGGAGFEAGKIDDLLDQDADSMKAQADAPDAGLERHALREAAEAQRRFAEDVRAAQAAGVDIAPPPKNAKNAPPKPAAPATSPDLEAWCKTMVATGQWADQHFADALAGQKQLAINLPPIPPPPSIDYWDCYGCEADKQKQYEKDAKEWVVKQWDGVYLEPELRAIRAAIDYGKKEALEGPALAQAQGNPASACAALPQAGANLKGGFDAKLMKIGLTGINNKMILLERTYGRKDQYPTGRPVWLAYIGTLKMQQLLTCTDVDLSQVLDFIIRQMGKLQDDWYRKLTVEKDLRQLGNMAFIFSIAKQHELLSLQFGDPAWIIETGVMDVKLDFQVKLGGQNAGAGGYVAAHVSGGGPLFAYTDPDDKRCGLLRSVDMKGAFISEKPLSLRVRSAEMFGPKFRNKYLAPNYFDSTVVIDLPCCRKNQPPDKALLYMETLGIRSGKETWSEPAYALFPAVDNWFRLAFNVGAMMKMVDSGQAEAEAAQLEKDMAVKQQEMDELQARYDRGEATLADLMAGANKMKDSLTGGASLGKNAFLSQAQHYRLEVPFQNNQAVPIKVKIDARNLLQGGSEAEEGLLENLAYGFGDVELRLRSARNVKPKPVPKPP